MKKRTLTGITTAAPITTASISVINNPKPENLLKADEGAVQAATYQ